MSVFRDLLELCSSGPAHPVIQSLHRPTCAILHLHFTLSHLTEAVIESDLQYVQGYSPEQVG